MDFDSNQADPFWLTSALAELSPPKAEADRFGQLLVRGWPRSQTGVPLVIEPEGSTFRSYGSITNTAINSWPQNLFDWQLRHLTAAYHDPVFAAWAREQLGEFDPDLADLTSSDKAALSQVTNEAMRVTGHRRRADLGTFLHWVCDQVDLRQDPHRADHLAHMVGLDSELVFRFAQHYLQFSSRLGQVVSVEQPVVNDRFWKAGQIDRVLRLNIDITSPAGNLPAGCAVIADLKSGSSWGGAKTVTQLALYSRSVPYDAVTASRRPWLIEPDQNLGLVIQIDAAAALAGQPRISMRVVALDAGLKLARAATDLRFAEKECLKASAFAEPIMVTSGD